MKMRWLRDWLNDLSWPNVRGWWRASRRINASLLGWMIAYLNFGVEESDKREAAWVEYQRRWGVQIKHVMENGSGSWCVYHCCDAEVCAEKHADA